jgi:hypothetical protein
VARSACFRSTMFSTCSLSHFIFPGGCNEDYSRLARSGRSFKAEYRLAGWMVENESALLCPRPLREGTAPKSASELRWQKASRSHSGSQGPRLSLHISHAWFSRGELPGRRSRSAKM